MAYLALYREWRPKNFKEIVGQEHVRIILTNAIRQDKVAHAYLFSGPRGTGKTTAAKILAKALNCANRNDAEPCNKCASCQEIDQGLALDVLEIDAASNRGIDEIRNLREKIKLAPSGGKNKVYIIDEVHMLTAEAFNALLKTLEEPPANVVFVLATTEAHKVPLTILSRVQRFEFHRISAAGILTRLKEVCTALGRNVEEKALQVIAFKAEGGLRDALSVLDQCLLQEDPIKAEHVYQVIGMVGEAYSADLTDSLLEGDFGSALARLEEGVALGRDPRQIIKELLDYLRQALLYAAGGKEPLLSPDTASRLIAQSKKAGLKKLLSWINVLLKGDGELRYAANARLAAEMILVQALYEQSTPALSEQIGITVEGRESLAPSNTGTQSFAAASKVSSAAPVAEKKKASGISSNLPVNPDQASDLFPLVKAKWSEILEGVKKEKKSTHAFLLEGNPVSLKEELLYVVFNDKFSFHRDKFNQPENKNVVEGIIEQLLGAKLTLISMLENEYNNLKRKEAEAAGAGKEITEVSTEKLPEGKLPGGDEESCIQQAVEYFGQELVQVSKDK